MARDGEFCAVVELTIDDANMVSQRVIESNGGVCIEVFRKPASHGATLGKRFRISLLPLGHVTQVVAADTVATFEQDSAHDAALQ